MLSKRKDLLVNGWIKVFNDGTEEKVLDEDILSGKGSWTKGRLDNIAGVILLSQGLLSRLYVPGTEWHQFDKFALTVAPGKYRPTRTNQVAQALIKPHHVGLFIEFNSQRRASARSARVVRTPHEHFHSLELKNRHVGQWLSLCVDKDLKARINFAAKRGQLPR